MNKLDREKFKDAYDCIKAAMRTLMSIDPERVCGSLYTKMYYTNEFVENNSNLFERSACELTDYENFYSTLLNSFVRDLREHLGYMKKEIFVDKMLEKSIKDLFQIVVQYKSLFGYSEPDDKVNARQESGSYFSRYDFTLPVSLVGEKNER